MNILALDLGTTTGWAYRDPATGRLVASSTELMTKREIAAQAKIRMDRRQDGRILRFWERLNQFFRAYPVDWLVFEDVQFAKSRMQAHLWASFRTTVWLFAAERGLKVECLSTDRLKLFATGSGIATKELMAAWLPRKCSEVRFFDNALRLVDGNEILDDNAVDAAHLLLWSESVLKHEPTKT